MRDAQHMAVALPWQAPISFRSAAVVLGAAFDALDFCNHQASPSLHAPIPIKFFRSFDAATSMAKGKKKARLSLNAHTHMLSDKLTHLLDGTM